ncbi:MAG: hypothetical protein JWM21_1537 [Acidobacteria bacterium]|nr:hypothetical protein [Acidobacteriota bacterium]
MMLRCPTNFSLSFIVGQAASVPLMRSAMAGSLRTTANDKLKFVGRDSCRTY